MIDGVRTVARMTIRNLDEKLKARLRVQAAKHGRSMEDEARDILRTALATPAARNAPNLVRAIRRRVEPLGGVDLQIPSREPMREPISLQE